MLSALYPGMLSPRLRHTDDTGVSFIAQEAKLSLW